MPGLAFGKGTKKQEQLRLKVAYVKVDKRVLGKLKERSGGSEK